jgi:putative heme-binding domain-containing protein
MHILAVLLFTAAFMAIPVAAQQPAPGDPTRGAALFSGKGGCQTCHRVRDTGSRLAPDLTEVGAIRTPEQLRVSLIDPNKEILPEGRFFRVVTREGTTITGRLLNLDTYQVHMIDSNQQLRSFTRAELREQGFVKESAMPSLQGKLSDEELADLVAYLGTLKGVQPQ